MPGSLSVRRALHHQRMDRVLLNPWVSRAGNLSFLIGVVVLVYRLLAGQDPLWVLTIALLAIGVVLIAAPRVETWRLPAAAPSWRYGREKMGQRQVAQLTALERERQGYVHRLKSGRDRLSRRDLKSRIAQVDDQIVRARDAWWEPEPRFDLLTPTLARGQDGFAYLSILNRGPTIVGARINLYAPKRSERQWLARIEKSGEPASEFGSFSDIDDELVPGFPKSVRWAETNLEIHGYTNTEWQFFLPPYPGDPVHLKIGADALGGWNGWVFREPCGRRPSPSLPSDAGNVRRGGPHG
jgi:hypothetical protein